MDIIRLYRDYGIPIAPEEHQHSRPGWVNTECPFCTGNPGYHLGWNEDNEYFFCYRCGYHPPTRTVSTLLKIPYASAETLLRVYHINRTLKQIVTQPKKSFLLPYGTSKFRKQHFTYLDQRGFDARKIEGLWKLQATGPIGTLDGDYRFRIIIPFFWNNEMVSFDSRDVTNKQTSRYKACPKTRELIPRKSILYGLQEHWTDTGICVEGPTDVWRLGVNSFAVSGIEYTHEQVRVMAQTFKRVAVIFDDEIQAQKQAKKLVADLKFRGVNAWNVKITGDPGSMKQNKADELVKSIIK